MIGSEYPQAHAAVRVANGGFVVSAWVLDDEEWRYETSCFTDLDTCLGYVRRVCSALIGPNEMSPGDTIGGLRLD